MASCAFYQTTLTAAADAATGKPDRFIAPIWPRIFTSQTAFRVWRLVEALTIFILQVDTLLRLECP